MLAEWAKIYAFEESIKMACALNIMTVVVFETDNASLANRVKHHSMVVAIIGARVKDKLWKILNQQHYVRLISIVTWWQISFVKKMSFDSCNWFFNMDYPLEIHELIISDVI